MKIFKNDVIRLCVSLFVITAVVSLALAGVNALTKDRIAALEGEAEFSTVRQFYDYDAIFEKLTLEDGTEYFAAYKPANAGAETPDGEPSGEEASEETAESAEESAEASSEASESSSSSASSSSEASSSSSAESSTEPSSSEEASSAEPETPGDNNGGEESAEDEPVSTGEKGELLGYAVTVSENGYGGEIKMLVCFDKFGQVNGMGVISMSETNGVGTRITGEGFFDQFTGKVGPFKFVKGTPSGKNDIAAITGASISSKAAVSAVNKAFVLLSDLFIEG